MIGIVPDHDGNFADRPVLFHIRAVKSERLIGDGKADRLFLSRQEKYLLKRFQFPDRPHALCDGIPRVQLNGLFPGNAADVFHPHKSGEAAFFRLYGKPLVAIFRIAQSETERVQRAVRRVRIPRGKAERGRPVFG